MSQQRTQPPRQYGTEEVQEILQRTSSLERKKQLERPTLALSEIETIAKEAGLDPRTVIHIEVNSSQIAGGLFGGIIGGLGASLGANVL